MIEGLLRNYRPVFLWFLQSYREYRNDGETLRGRKSPVEYEIIIKFKRESKYEEAIEKIKIQLKQKERLQSVVVPPRYASNSQHPSKSDGNEIHSCNDG